MNARLRIVSTYGAPVLGLIVAQAVLPLGLDVLAAMVAVTLAAIGGYRIAKGQPK